VKQPSASFPTGSRVSFRVEEGREGVAEATGTAIRKKPILLKANPLLSLCYTVIHRPVEIM
jgi:hypothetical protein